MTKYLVTLSDGTTRTITVRSARTVELMIGLLIRDGFLRPDTTIASITTQVTRP